VSHSRVFMTNLQIALIRQSKVRASHPSVADRVKVVRMRRASRHRVSVTAFRGRHACARGRRSGCWGGVDGLSRSSWRAGILASPGSRAGAGDRRDAICHQTPHASQRR
jgi:hypothetical protein